MGGSERAHNTFCAPRTTNGGDILTMKNRRLKTMISIFTLWLLLLTCLTGCAETVSETMAPKTSSRSASPELDASALNVHFLDIGQGDCIVITQGNHAMMIDAGDNDKGTAVQSYLNYLGIDTLEYFILTHPDADHIGGADVILYKFDCETVLMPDKAADTRTYDDVIQAMKTKRYSAKHPKAGESYTFGDASFTILGPVQEYSDNNNNSIVICMTYGDNSFLFTGDAEEEAEADILSEGLEIRADVLKAGHHGSSTSTSDEFLEAVSPEYAVISCGEGNKYGHPHAETMNKFRQNGITVYRTDEQGTIIASSDGKMITWSESPSDSWMTGEPAGSASSIIYVLNTNSHKFHLPDCSSVEDIAPANREETTQSREELTKAGYDPCGRCKP